MEQRNSHADDSTTKRTCHYGLRLSSSEKASLRRFAEKEKFLTISQFIRQRCLNETLTNSELANELMIRIAQKIELECAKNYPVPKDKEYTEEMLHPPKSLKSSEIAEEDFIENKEKARPERSCYVGFTLTREEKECLKDNASKAGYKTISKYIRNRCLKEQISKKDVINILLSFFAIKFAEGLLSPDRKLEWKRQSVKKLKLVLDGL